MDNTDNIPSRLFFLFSFGFWPAFGIINDPKSLTSTEGSEGKHSCASGVEAELLSLPLTMHERVMSLDDREVLQCIMPAQRGLITVRQRRRNIVYIVWLLMIHGGKPVIVRVSALIQ